MLNKIQVVIFNSDECQKSNCTQNQLYDFFVEIWEDTWSELNINSNNFKDDFYRFDTKIGFILDGRLIAFHGYSSFDLSKKNHREHSYFSKLEAPIADLLYQKGIKNVATTEYMAVHPEYRKVAGQYIAEILGGFTTQYFKYDTSYDAMITIARNNRGVNQMCKMFGAYCLKENEKLHDVNVDIMVFKPESISSSPNSTVSKTVDRLINEAAKKNTINTTNAA